MARHAGSVRIGAAFEPTAAAFYRGVYPLEAMMRRGHEIVWPRLDSGEAKVEQFEGCDVVYVFRRSEAPLRQALAPLVARGVGLVWDSDDDLSAIPRRSPNYKEIGALRGQQRFADTVRIARLAHLMLASTETIKAKYERAGIEGIEVLENYLPPRIRRRRERHDGLLIGWIAGIEHTEDAIALRLRETLERVLARHPDVHVETVGVDLGLRERYIRHPSAHFDDLPQHMARYDIGIAPLVDIPFNAARSNIKVKEYAASGVPWLASPRAPYRALGEREGGLLVEDDAWEAALDGLIRDKRRRNQLARAGKSWAKTQRIDRVADRVERLLQTAAERATQARAA
jgi:Glycosyl transferases group 1